MANPEILKENFVIVEDRLKGVIMFDKNREEAERLLKSAERKNAEQDYRLHGKDLPAKQR